MIGIKTPGPIHLFARFRNNDTAWYLGTCVSAPEPEHEKFKIPVMNDLGGRSVPFQLIQDGEQALITATLNRFDLALLQSIRALESGTPGGAAGPLGNLLVGQELPQTRGTLVLAVSDFQLLLFNEYAGTVSAGAGADDLPLGRLYFSATLRKYKESTVGTRVLEVALAIECNNIYNPTLRAFYSGAAGNQGAGLYTENPAQFGTVAPIT